MEPVRQKLLAITGPDKGGYGKSILAMLLADCVRSRPARVAQLLKNADPTQAKLLQSELDQPHDKLAIIDCDTGNQGKPFSLGHAFPPNTVRNLDIRRPRDLDSILQLTASTSADLVICDLPANSSCNMRQWWSDIATADVLDEIGIRLVTLIALPDALGATQHALEWINDIGERGSFIVALNRIEYALSPLPIKEAFADWFSIDTSGFKGLHVIEVPHLDGFAMTELIRAAKLPWEVDIEYFINRRIRAWAARVHTQLESTTLL